MMNGSKIMNNVVVVADARNDYIVKIKLAKDVSEKFSDIASTEVLNTKVHPGRIDFILTAKTQVIYEAKIDGQMETYRGEVDATYIYNGELVIAFNVGGLTKVSNDDYVLGDMVHKFRISRLKMVDYINSL